MILNDSINTRINKSLNEATYKYLPNKDSYKSDRLRRASYDYMYGLDDYNGYSGKFKSDNSEKRFQSDIRKMSNDQIEYMIDYYKSSGDPYGWAKEEFDQKWNKKSTLDKPIKN